MADRSHVSPRNGALNGYHGRILVVDVGARQSQVVEVPGEIYEQCIGGVGLATLVLLALEQFNTSPTDHDAAIVFAFSPLVGTPLTTSAKFTVACRSPQTNLLNDSLASSQFAIRGKRTGFDAIVLTGQCQSPNVVLVDDDLVRIEPADQLWGLECSANG